MSDQELSMEGPELILERPRTHMCGQLRAQHVDEEVVLMGWVQTRRDHGGAVFIDLRDRTGIAQIVFDASDLGDAHRIAEALRNEWVLGIIGKVRSRGENVNPNLATGDIEVVASFVKVFNPSKTPPFDIEDDTTTAEDKRLSYRYLDLRRPALQKKLMMRAKLNHAVRSSLVEQGFIELETPYMVKYTPGGARNFMVPSRLNPGNFYALAESPQLYKQLFMIAGFDRYFQITKCFRDEDLRQDRQPEFTQIDLEMSFAGMKDVQAVMEKVIRTMFKEGMDEPVELPEHFPTMSYDEAMRRFGSDKPDLRFGLEHVLLTDLVKTHQGGGIGFFEQAVNSGGIVKVMVVPAEHSMSRSEVDKLEKEAKGVGAAGLGRAKIGADGQSWEQSPLAKMVTDDLRLAINAAAGAKPGDLLLFQSGPAKIVHTALNHLRLLLGHKLGLIDETRWELLWVVEFPLFEYDEVHKRHVAAHHPFTAPRPEDVDRLTTDPGSCRAQAYDLVLNGNEIGGGSVRIHDSGVQAKVFQALGISEEEQQQKFGFLLEALAYGAPPHAGIAGGMDRIAMLLARANSLREVIPYPKTQRGQDLMTQAPTPVAEAQLREVWIQTLSKPQAPEKA